MNAIALSIVALAATMAGGVCALRYRDHLHFLLSLTAGVLLGVVCFDILPEIFTMTSELGGDVTGPMVALAAGFLFFHGLEKFVLLHHAQEDRYAKHRHPKVGVLSAMALIGHSFMDGVGIGLAFQVSTTVGFTVAIAVIAHDFCDGLNTVGLMLASQNSNRRSMIMLVFDGLAPVLGAASTLAFHVPPSVLVLYLGFFAGFLLYIGAADILPEAHSRSSPAVSVWLMALTCFGAALMYLVVRLSS